MHKAQSLLPYEKNWTNEINKLLVLYGLEPGQVSEISKETWKNNVKKAVVKRAFSHLRNECISKSKTKMAVHNDFRCQEYLLNQSWKSSSIIFKLRGGVADCLVNKKSSFVNTMCRLCGLEVETQAHVINCPKVAIGNPLDISRVYESSLSSDEQILEIVDRYDRFVDLVHKKGD